jgi:hypothetical protein
MVSPREPTTSYRLPRAPYARACTCVANADPAFSMRHHTEVFDRGLHLTAAL